MIASEKQRFWRILKSPKPKWVLRFFLRLSHSLRLLIKLIAFSEGDLYRPTASKFKFLLLPKSKVIEIASAQIRNCSYNLTSTIFSYYAIFSFLRQTCPIKFFLRKVLRKCQRWISFFWKKVLTSEAPCAWIPAVVQ